MINTTKILNRKNKGNKSYYLKQFSDSQYVIYENSKVQDEADFSNQDWKFNNEEKAREFFDKL
ncbi:MAG: hypothetical protein AAB453_04990 [Patescibacteria group bacterium]